MDVDITSDGSDELLEVLEDSASDAVMGQVAEESFNHIEPRSGCRREVNMEAFVHFQPTLDSCMFVSRVVIADQIDFLVSRYGLIDHAQELQPLLMTVFLLTQAEDLSIGGIQHGEQGRECRCACSHASWLRTWPFFIGSPGWVQSRA